MASVNRYQTYRRNLARTAIAVVLVLAAGVFGLQGPQNTPVVDALSAPYGAGGEYHPITPIRILNTRDPLVDVAPPGRKPTAFPEGPEFLIPALGFGQIPKFTDANGDGLDDNVLALAVNVTVADPSSAGQVKMYAAGAGAGISSLANFDPHQDVPNFAIMRPGKDGKLAARINTVAKGDADLIIDVFGYFTTSNAPTRGARLTTIAPARVFDQRIPDRPGLIGPGAGNQVQIPIRGAVEYRSRALVVPNDPTITGVIVNVTAVNASTGTYVAALPTRHPAGPADTDTSLLNIGPQQQRAATAIVPIGPDGSIYLFNKLGNIDLIVDVVGYTQTGAAESTTAGRVIPLETPYRAGDSREVPHGKRPIGPGQAEDWSFEKFIADVKISGEWVGAQQGFIANLGATQLKRQYASVPTNGSFLALSPPPADGVSAIPGTSSVNFAEGKDVPNMVIARYGTNSADGRCAVAQCVRVFNSSGYVDYFMDISAVILA